MEQLFDITPEKHMKGFSYFEKNPTTEQIFKRRKLSEYSSTFSYNNPHYNNNNSSLHSSIDEYTYSAQNCSSSRSSSNNNNKSSLNPTPDNYNKQNQEKQQASYQYSIQKLNNQKESKQHFTTSFQPTKQQNGLNKGKISLNDFIYSSQGSHPTTSPQKNADGQMNLHQKSNKQSSSQSSCVINRNLFDYNNYSFQQLLNQNDTQGNTTNEIATERKSFDSVLQNSFQNLTISENNNQSMVLQNQDSLQNQKRSSIISIPKAIKAQTPQFFPIKSKGSISSTTPVQQTQIITASSLNNILLNQINEKDHIGQVSSSQSQIIGKTNKLEQNRVQFIDSLNEEDEDFSDHSQFSQMDLELDHEYLEQYHKNVQNKQKQSIDQISHLIDDKKFQQSANRGRLQLGDSCPLKALKKQFPIIFPVGIPIMGQLSKLLNIDEIEQNGVQNRQIDNSLLQDEIIKQQQQQDLYSINLMEQQIDPLLGNLTRTERREKVEKYLEKKKNRKWKNIRYNIRKNLADQRERVQGRFVKQKNGRFNFDLLDAQYLKQLSKESDKMRLLESSHNTDNSFDIQNHSFDI